MQTSQDNSISALVNSAITDGQALVKAQIELTKAELSESAKQAAASSGMLVGAGVLGFLAFVFLLVAAGYGLVAAGLAEWAAFLIVAGALLLVAALLALIGRKRAQQLGPPQRAMAQMEQTRTLIKGRGGSVA